MFNMFGPQQGLRMPNGPALGLTMGSPSSPGSQPGVPGLQIPPGLGEQMNRGMLAQYANPKPSPLAALSALQGLGGMGQQPIPVTPVMSYRAPMMPFNPFSPRPTAFNTGRR